MQRLRYIRQLGFSFLTYPNANHSRFEHSLGTYWVVRRLLESSMRLPALETGSGNQAVYAVAPDSHIQNLVSMAALLHDIGHGPFSHALESIVENDPENWRVGPFSVKDFSRKMDDANMELFRGQSSRAIVPAKNFCELFAAAIITSRRFIDLYRVLPETGSNPEEDVISIACLLLGVPIEKNQPGFSHVISGPIDADKLDYLIRDSQACGISISLDISRVLFRAGFYCLSDPNLHPQSRVLDFDKSPVTVFVVEQSGTDALRELALSRLSLYSRVYYHQCTRNAEKTFSRALKLWAGSSSRNFLEVWRMGDEELLATLRRSTASANAAKKIWARRLPKRAVALTADCYSLSDLPVRTDLAAQIKKARKRAIDQVDLLVDEFFRLGSDHEWALELEQEVLTIERRLGRGHDDGDLEWHTVPIPRHKDPTATALCLSDDRSVEVAEPHLPQFVKSGEFPISRRYLFCHPSKRIPFAIAIQRIISKRRFPFTVEYSETNLSGLFCPRVQVERSNRICKLQKIEFETACIDLARSQYFDDAPFLFPLNAHRHRVEAISERLSGFSGGFAWRVDANHVQHFVEQFPPSLRTDALDWLDQLEVEDWHSFARKTELGIQSIRSVLPAPKYWIVPLSFTSGTQICKALDEVTKASTSMEVMYDIRAAIDKAQKDDGIIFVDDNIASGTQATRAVDTLFGKQTARTERSTYQTSLSPEAIEKLRTLKVAFVFAWGHTAGIDRLHECTLANRLAINASSIIAISPLIAKDNKKNISGPLRDFLRKVGTQLVAHDEALDGQSFDAAYALGEDRALGYGNAEGYLVGQSGVPSSTFTALFMPGKISYRLNRPWKQEDWEWPWRPLVLRSQKAWRLVAA